jgi:hypothetical protein
LRETREHRHANDDVDDSAGSFAAHAYGNLVNTKNDNASMGWGY